MPRRAWRLCPRRAEDGEPRQRPRRTPVRGACWSGQRPPGEGGVHGQAMTPKGVNRKIVSRETFAGQGCLADWPCHYAEARLAALPSSRRRWRTTATTAAGVNPGSLLAWPTVSGRRRRPRASRTPKGVNRQIVSRETFAGRGCLADWPCHYAEARLAALPSSRRRWRTSATPAADASPGSLLVWPTPSG